MKIRVSRFQPALPIALSPAPTMSRSHLAIPPAVQQLASPALECRLVFVRFPAGTCFQQGWIAPLLQQRRLVIRQSMNGNGKPSNGTMKGFDDSLPAYETFDQAGIEPLGHGWDPWKQSSRVSKSTVREPDASIREQAGEISGRNGVGTPSLMGVNTYGVVGKEGEEPYRILANGKKVYLDELDILTLLDPPPFLKPMSSVKYNHAAFLWKKIADIPEERRQRLLDLLEPKHITAMWKLTQLRYEDPELYLEDASRFLHGSPAGKPLQTVIWTGQVNEVPSIIGWFSRFKKAFFYTKEGELYGRLIAGERWTPFTTPGGRLLEGLGRVLTPLYFQVRPVRTVPATKELCDFAFSYEDGHYELKNSVPNGYPQPGRHPWPFGEGFFDYVRVVGPGVVAGQSWYGAPPAEDQKDPNLFKTRGPRKYLGEFVLIQNFEKPT